MDDQEKKAGVSNGLIISGSKQLLSVDLLSLANASV